MQTWTYNKCYSLTSRQEITLASWHAVKISQFGQEIKMFKMKNLLSFSLTKQYLSIIFFQITTNLIRWYNKYNWYIIF